MHCYICLSKACLNNLLTYINAFYQFLIFKKSLVLYNYIKTLNRSVPLHSHVQPMFHKQQIHFNSIVLHLSTRLNCQNIPTVNILYIFHVCLYLMSATVFNALTRHTRGHNIAKRSRFCVELPTVFIIKMVHIVKVEGARLSQSQILKCF